MQVDVFHDTVCPWCRIGDAHLKEAITQWDGEPIEVRWHPFFLQPYMPAEGRDFAQHMASIKGDSNIQPMFERVCQAGEACELTFNFDKVGRSPNTLLSHCLIEAAPPAQRDAVLESIHRAYFEEGRDIGDLEVLLDIAEAHELDRVETAKVLADPALKARVNAEADWARRQGISGVPFFVVNGELAVSGAQPASMLLSAFRRSRGAAAVRS